MEALTISIFSKLKQVVSADVASPERRYRMAGKGTHKSRVAIVCSLGCPKDLVSIAFEINI